MDRRVASLLAMTAGGLAIMKNGKFLAFFLILCEKMASGVFRPDTALSNDLKRAGGRCATFRAPIAREAPFRPVGFHAIATTAYGKDYEKSRANCKKRHSSR